MPAYKKKDFPTHDIRRFLEVGPIVLVSSAHKGKTNIMTMGWHMVMEFSPSLVGCLISSGNHSFEMVKASRECVINVPTQDLATTVVKIGNTSGRDIDKFKAFGLTALPASEVQAPLIAECFANLECRVTDTRMVRRYNLFVLEVVAAWIDPKQKNPKTIHHHGYGTFVVDGPLIHLKSRMR